MYIEDQYIQEQFHKNFLESALENIVIYGTGIHTERLLENIKDQRIAGLMDAARTGEELFGKRVLSYEEVEEIQNVVIVILARNAVINVIYRRIEEFVLKHNIAVYDINGNNLGNSVDKNTEYDCFKLKQDELEEMIENADVISFDIFDTLITRCIMRPRDIFSVMDELLVHKEYKFSYERAKAESDLPKGSNPTIYNIYTQLQKNTRISDAEIKELICLEIDTEKRFLKPREKMCQILQNAVLQGKDVYLISDMYFTHEILTELLASCHIAGYKKLYVSCEYKVSKEEGLFETFLHEERIESKKCLHIGDNYYSDIVSAKALGFQTYQIYSSIEMFESSIYAGGLKYCNSLEENIVLSYLAVKAYNNPFCSCHSNGKLVIKSTNDLIKLFIAPVVFKYIIWLLQNVCKGNNDVIIFPSRDGYLLEKMYHLVKNKYKQICLPDSIYFYTSRRAALVAAASTPSDINYIMDIPYSGDIKTMIQERFGVEIELCDGIENSHIEDLLKKCREEREYYKKYIGEAGIGKYRNIAFVDFVAMGTVQEALQRLFQKEMSGYYFLQRSAYKKEAEDLKCLSLYEKAGDFQISSNLYKFYYFLEAIITSNEPAFKNIDNKGRKVFYNEQRDEETIQTLMEIQNSILEYSKELLDLLPNIFEAAASVDLYDCILGFFSKDFSDLATEEINCFTNVDEFMGKNVSEINR